jgi:hypothetical protein
MATQGQDTASAPGGSGTGGGPRARGPAWRGLAGGAALLAVALLLAAGVLALSGVLGDEEVEPALIFDSATGQADDPFAYGDDRRADFEARATLGNSHVLYALSPGGVVETAARVAAFREQIERAAAAHGADPELMEAMVFLESAGRPDVIAGGTDAAAAAGLGQIVASTGLDLLGMDVDLARSQELTDTINESLQSAANLRERAIELAGASKLADRKRAAKLEQQAIALEREAERARRERIAVDERFDPEAALDGMARYLEIAAGEFGREDLAVASYHMGIGNLGDVISRFTGEPESEQLGVIADRDLSYAEIYFASSPTERADAYELLAGFGDDSSTYLWRVLAAQRIMELWRQDRAELKRLADLHANKATAEEVFHPPDETEAFADAEQIADALEDGELVAIPDDPELGFEIGKQLGELAPELGQDPELYASLRPEALATLVYMAGLVEAATGKPDQQLIVTSAVRDEAYQAELVNRNDQATDAYSLHTTGWSFDILRRYANDRHAQAFQFALDRLQDLGVIDYAVEPEAIHVTVSELAAPLLE